MRGKCFDVFISVTFLASTARPTGVLVGCRRRRLFAPVGVRRREIRAADTKQQIGLGGPDESNKLPSWT